MGEGAREGVYREEPGGEPAESGSPAGCLLVIATAILDRLLHHSHVLSIRGDNRRMREKKPVGSYCRVASNTQGGEGIIKMPGLSG